MQGQNASLFSVGLNLLNNVALSTQSSKIDELQFPVLQMPSLYKMHEARAKINTTLKTKTRKELYISTERRAKATGLLVTL